jgi:hypothetical protein
VVAEVESVERWRRDTTRSGGADSPDANAHVSSIQRIRYGASGLSGA